MTASAQTRVTLVDDHSIMRDLLRDALENTGEFRKDTRRCYGRNLSCVAPVVALSLTDRESP